MPSRSTASPHRPSRTDYLCHLAPGLVVFVAGPWPASSSPTRSTRVRRRRAERATPPMRADRPRPLSMTRVIAGPVIRRAHRPPRSPSSAGPPRRSAFLAQRVGGGAARHRARTPRLCRGRHRPRRHRRGVLTVASRACATVRASPIPCRTSSAAGLQSARRVPYGSPSGSRCSRRGARRPRAVIDLLASFPLMTLLLPSRPRPHRHPRSRLRPALELPGGRRCAPLARRSCSPHSINRLPPLAATGDHTVVAPPDRRMPGFAGSADSGPYSALLAVGAVPSLSVSRRFREPFLPLLRPFARISSREIRRSYHRGAAALFSRRPSHGPVVPPVAWTCCSPRHRRAHVERVRECLGWRTFSCRLVALAAHALGPARQRWVATPLSRDVPALARPTPFWSCFRRRRVLRALSPHHGPGDYDPLAMSLGAATAQPAVFGLR